MHVDFNILAFSLAMAYSFTSIFRGRLFQRKPFNCVKCLTGWAALITGLLLQGWPGLIYLPFGFITGALWEKICMRWL